MTENSTCFICHGIEFCHLTAEYRRCRRCGHESLVSGSIQGLIINDFLDVESVRKQSGLDKFKARVLAKFDESLERSILLDIGSASGKFLLHNAGRYKCGVGLEVTPESVAFSREVMGLEIVEEIDSAPDCITLATAWHTLEHIPEDQLTALLDVLSSKMLARGRFIVSVPNADSWQYRWFNRAYAYFDVPNHLHQFTLDSLERLMSRSGFLSLEAVNSTPYNRFGYIQSLLNCFTGSHNYLYYRLKRRSRAPSLLLDLANGLLLPFLVPVGWALAVLDSFTPKRQGVLTVCFKKKTD